MIWAILIVLLFLLIGGGSVILVALKVKGQRSVIEGNLVKLKGESKAKETLITELAVVALGYSSLEGYQALEKNTAEVEELVRVEKGKYTISEAELEALETRLRELEELAREVESSNIESQQELDMLRSQEKNMASTNDDLKAKVESAMSKLDLLIDELASSQEAVTHLTNAKAELIKAQEKIQWYQEDIANLNVKYMSLKRAYDALDIEYAQLYEKRNEMEREKQKAQAAAAAAAAA